MSIQLGFNTNYFTQPTSREGQGLILARVDKVILGPVDSDGNPDLDFQANKNWASIGSIYYTTLDDILNVETETTGSKSIARPLYSNLKHYPLRGEIVQLLPGPSPDMNTTATARDYFYTSPYNLWNSVHQNAFPNMLNYYAQVTKQTTGYEATAAGAVKSNVTSSIGYKLGNTFKERSYIKDLRPYEGDIIHQGRWGQSIRFGSTVKDKGTPNPWSTQGSDGDPIMIIRNGQSEGVSSFIGPTEPWTTTIEDINNDAASIYLCNGQNVKIADLNNYNLASFASRDRIQQANIQERRTSPISTDAISPNAQSTVQLASAQSSQQVNLKTK